MGVFKEKPFGYKFRRQHPYRNYILDFYCHALQLVIEVDGSIHEEADIKENDKQRECVLIDCGLTILRFPNQQILNRMDEVIQTLQLFITSKEPKK